MMLGGRITNEYGHISRGGLKEGALYQLLSPEVTPSLPLVRGLGRTREEPGYLYSSRPGLGASLSFQG